MNRHFIKFSTFLLFFANLCFSFPLTASAPSEEADNVQYKKGLIYRGSGDTQQAIECFSPLAEKGHVKAQHNLAMLYFKINDEAEAYQWFKRASDQNFEPSKNNLTRMNLLCILLPNEILCHISSFLDLKSLSNFKFASHKTYRAFVTTITRTNFLTSKNPYARDFRSRFSQVTFEPQPQSIRMVRSVKSVESSIMVHFRNPKHLREIVEETPEIKAKRKVYFVKDNSVEDGKEITAIEEQLQYAFFIHVIADKPLKLKGELKLSCEIVLPSSSDFNAVKFKGKAISCSNLTAYTEANALATSIETFNEQLFEIRTSDAHELLVDRRKERLKSSGTFPHLLALCPNLKLFSKDEVQISQHDYISSNKPLIYIANTIESHSALVTTLPEFSQSICYINPEISHSGVYCLGPLFLQMGHEIYSKEDITMLGTASLDHYNLTFNLEGSVWSWAVIKAVDIKISCKNWHIGSMSKIFNENRKPDDMPEVHWKALLEDYKKGGFFINPPTH